jgi:hypothetical protein
MHSIFSNRIQGFASSRHDPLFPGIAFRSRWLDNVRAYRSSDLTEKHFLEFAAHDLLLTARNTKATDVYGLVGTKFRNRLIDNLPNKPISLQVTDHFLGVLRERCFDDIPAMKLLGDVADVSLLIDVHRRYGSTNIYGATDPTPSELNQAVTHFSSVLEDYARMARLSIAAADENAFEGITATAETASTSFGNICDPKVLTDIQSRAAELREATSPYRDSLRLG